MKWLPLIFLLTSCSGTSVAVKHSEAYIIFHILEPEKIQKLYDTIRASQNWPVQQVYGFTYKNNLYIPPLKDSQDWKGMCIAGHELWHIIAEDYHPAGAVIRC